VSENTGKQLFTLLKSSAMNNTVFSGVAVGEGMGVKVGYGVKVGFGV
jgi:hypothetical protein